MPKSVKNIQWEHAKTKLKILGLAGLLSVATIKTVNVLAKPKAETELTISKKSQKNILKKTYKITDRETFNQLWNDAKPLCVPVLILSENWRLDFHHDRGAKATPNSVCAGLYYYPKNGNFNSKTWITTRQYCINYQNSHKGKLPKNCTPQNIRDGVYGWGESMENGRHLNKLYNVLVGCELTINEFAAIYSHYFHTGNLNTATKIASIKQNKKIKDKSLAGAKALLDTDQPTLPGQKSRFMHEALVFMNTDDYCHDLFSLCVDCHLGTSINACPSEYNNIKGGKLTHDRAQIIKDKICNYTVKGGKQIKYLCNQINDDNIMVFCITTQHSKQIDERNDIYRNAMIAYNNQDYKTAKKLFIQVMEKHGEGPDLWNDMAITYYNLGDYENCIEMCRRVLHSDKNTEYAKACFNAGKAYEALGNYTKAMQNYKAALNYYNKYGIAGKDASIDYADIYRTSINRVKKQIPQAKQTSQQKHKATKKQTTKKGGKKKKSTVFFLATMAIANKNKKRSIVKQKSR